jgi:hypothetical protein
LFLLSFELPKDDSRTIADWGAEGMRGERIRGEYSRVEKGRGEEMR